jgi:DNA-binding transcriptional ArsR family regulator
VSITVHLPSRGEETTFFAISGVLEAVQSWHVLADPGHHALQLPWVRHCRRLPKAVRTGLREFQWVVTDYIPSWFEVGAQSVDTVPFADELTLLTEVPAELIADELMLALTDTERLGDEPFGPDRHRYDPAARWRSLRSPALEPVFARLDADPRGVATDLLSVLADYWDHAFAAEWSRLSEQLTQTIAQAGAGMAEHGMAAILRHLIPAVRVDAQARTMQLPRSHEHEVTVSATNQLALTPSYFAWPHVRLSCDPPWQLRVIYPVVPAGGAGPQSGPLQEALPVLRALAGPARLELLALLAESPRSTSELADLQHMSPAAVSGNLKQLLGAGLVTAERDGPYVLYRPVGEAFRILADQLARFAGTPLGGSGSSAPS